MKVLMEVIGNIWAWLVSNYDYIILTHTSFYSSKIEPSVYRISSNKRPLNLSKFNERPLLMSAPSKS